MEQQTIRFDDIVSQNDHIRALTAVDSSRIEDYVSAFQELVQSEVVENLVTYALKNFEAHGRRMARLSMNDTWRMLRCDRFTLSVRRMNNGSATQGAKRFIPVDNAAAPQSPQGTRRVLPAFASDSLYGILGSGTLTADFYRSVSASGRFDLRVRMAARSQLRVFDRGLPW